MTQNKALEMWIGKVLLTSIILALILVISGGVWYLVHHALLPFDEHTIQATSTELPTLKSIFVNFWSPLGLIQGGLLLIIAGQIFRVALTGFMFYLERDKFFVLCTLVILIVMFVGFF